MLRTSPHKGSPPNPFTWAEACEKFGRYTASIPGAHLARAIIEAVGSLEQVPDMADVPRLVAFA